MALSLAALYFATMRPAHPPLGWGTDYTAAMEQARTDGRHVLVAFHMRGCAPCVAMEREVLVAPAVRAALADFIPVRLDVEQVPELANRMEVMGTPTYAVLDASGQVLSRCVGFQPAATFVRFLGRTVSATSELTPAAYRTRPGGA